MTFVINAGQADAATKFNDFLFSDETEFVISGPPGVGKTTLVMHLINTVIPAYQTTATMLGIPDIFMSVHLAATTNKAAEVLELSTGLPAMTIHSLLKLKLKTDFQTGKQSITRTKDAVPIEHTILFIDEASMVDRQLYALILQLTHKCKIVWVGDKDQMNPVGEQTSPVFTSGKQTVTLTQPMRTTIPELQALNEQLRETVQTGVFKPIKIIPGIIDWLDDEGLKQAITHYYSQQTTDHRILAYRNERVVFYNDSIRDLRGLPPGITVGENLVSASHISLNGMKVSIEKEFEITRVGKDNDIIIDGTKVDISNLDMRQSDGTLVLNFKAATDVQHFMAILKYLGREKDFVRMYNLKETIGELRPRDAATFYKAQGSTYDTVIIDVSDLSRCTVPDQVARQLYVGCSRPRTRVLFYGDLAEKYGGLVR